MPHGASRQHAYRGQDRSGSILTVRQAMAQNLHPLYSAIVGGSQNIPNVSSFLQQNRACSGFHEGLKWLDSNPQINIVDSATQLRTDIPDPLLEHLVEVIHHHQIH